MPPILTDTFGGLSVSYYFRQFSFGLAISALLYFVITQGQGAEQMQVAMWPFLILNTLLYPYARFSYEQVVGFVMGNNTFYIPIIIMLPVKLFTIIMCWGWAILIAPFGLIYLYFYHRRARRQISS
ncbi:hypothetical protein [Vreelandella alkaliphila]|uniref:hypothetical protein n=1 Tax=Vreelandella alkaliphila TaxID=272774 RepID=UPI003FD855C2